MFLLPFCAHLSLLITHLRYIILSKHSSVSSAIVSCALKVVLIHITSVFGSDVYQGVFSRPTRLATCHTLSVLSRVWAHAKTARLSAWSSSSSYFTRPEKITHCMTPHDLSLAIFTTFWMKMRKSRGESIYPFLTRVCNSKKLKTPSFWITPHSNRS